MAPSAIAGSGQHHKANATASYCGEPGVSFHQKKETMKNILIIFALLIIGCSSDAQQNNSTTEGNKAVVKDGFLISFEGINVAKYELNVEDFNVDEVTMNHLLCLATEDCDEQFARKLIERGVDVNFKCEDDDVITSVAFCKENGVELAKLLINKGANINGADQDNDSFLAYAISFDNLKLVEYLLEKGADKKQRDTNRNMGCLPIHGVKSVKMLELLISKGIQINELCNNGRNLLHFAAKEDLKEVAKYLVDEGLVNINQKDKNGETSLDYAARFNHPEIAEIIKNKK